MVFVVEEGEGFDVDDDGGGEDNGDDDVGYVEVVLEVYVDVGIWGVYVVGFVGFVGGVFGGCGGVGLCVYVVVICGYVIGGCVDSVGFEIFVVILIGLMVEERYVVEIMVVMEVCVRNYIVVVV